MTVQSIYSQAVIDGNYNLGNWPNQKHDYVRNIWEDYLFQLILKAPLFSLCSTRKNIRILDMGCGTGQGYKLIPFLQSGKFSYNYVGLDVNPDMIKKGKELFHATPNVEFHEHDLCNGLGSWKKHFDVYLSSYGSLSYLDDSQLLQILSEIASVAGHGSLVILDLLGRFSLEWPQYWPETSDAIPPYLHDYSISYLSSEAIYKQPMKMRFWSTEEINNLLKSNPGLSNLQFVKAVDRSILVGRHTDTREYNSDLPPIRSLVNQLFSHQLADLSSLIVKTDIIPSTAESIDQKVSEFLH
ncbi:MAG TPA: class I SAM-dependent methyltransferase, partial [Nostocaceae cyanobacterium]|nr:class I SAM-dependent methyltransferase [Nostocaceae cyanobacterium]